MNRKLVEFLGFSGIVAGILAMAVAFAACSPPGTPERPENGTTEFTVTFNSDGGSTVASIKVDKGSSMGDKYPANPTKKDFTFDGWYDGAALYTKDTAIDDNITLKAKWTAGAPPEVTVTFNSDGGSTVASIEVAKGSSMSNKYPADPTKAGFTFDGWYSDTTLYTKDTAIGDTITLKAKWTAVGPVHTVTFNTDGGSTAPASIKVPEGFGMDTQYPADPVKVGHNFTGWFDGTTPYNSTTKVNKALELKAGWTAPAGTPTASWKGLTVPSGTTAREYTTLMGKTDVLYVTPAGGDFGWAVLSQSLADYAGKEVTITVSVEVWLETPAKIAWQANLGSTYPTIAGNTGTNLNTGRWVKVEGSTKIEVPAGGGTFYLSGGGSGGQLPNTPAYLSNFVLLISDGSDPVTGDLVLTIGGKKDITDQLPNGVSAASVTWATSAPAVASVNNGVVKALTFTSGGGNTFVSGPATGTAVITATVGGQTVLEVAVTTTTAAQTGIMDLPPLKDQFAAHFPMIGNIFNPGDVSGGLISNQRLARHFNVLTHENNMKPSYLSSGYNFTNNTHTRNNSNFTTANNMITAATAANIKVVGHTLLWHSQTAQWQKDITSRTPEVALNAMKVYITDVVTFFKGKIYIWDVLNEVFPDGVSSSADWKNAMRTGGADTGNPWYVAIGSDFVYEGFLAARLADPDAILYYNDYNTDQVGKATMIRNMVRDVNIKYKADFPSAPHSNNGTRNLIEGIGMQEHHNTGVSANNIRATLNLFKPLGVRISVSELDVLGQSWGEYDGNKAANTVGNSTVTNTGLMTQARLYGEYMKLYIEFKDIIERVSIWGITDNQSWRAKGLPLLFDTSGRAKPAYYSFVGALE